jgi:putative DNA primase/helicase
VQEATAEYKNESDLVSQFIDDRCTLKPGVMEHKNDLFQAWQKWCAAEGEDDAARRGKRWVTTQFLARGLELGGHGNDSILGVKLNGV